MYPSILHPLVGLFSVITLGICGETPLTVQSALDHGYVTQDLKVPVVLGVMSACPDAILCESVFDRVLQQVGNKVELSLTFLGTSVHIVLAYTRHTNTGPGLMYQTPTLG